MTNLLAVLGGCPGVIESVWIHAICVATLISGGVGLDEVFERGVSTELRKDVWR